MEKQVLRFYGFKFIVCNIYRFVQAVLSLIPLLEQVSFRAVFLIVYLFILTFFVVVRVDLAVPFYILQASRSNLYFSLLSTIQFL